MKPQELIERLRYLAEQCPIDAVVFRVPSAPACTNHQMRLDVSPRDILDMLDLIDEMHKQLTYRPEEEMPRYLSDPYENPA